MATTTATITLASSDIADNSISISNTATLTKAGSTTGLDQTSGLRRRTFTSASTVKLIDLDHYQDQTLTENKAAKVYIKNMNDRGDGTKYVNILLAAVEIGRLYGGDWMFIPWCAASGKDIEFTASDTTETTLEYTCFYE